MPEISLIETTEIPATSRGGGNVRVQLAEDTLRRVLHQNKSVRVILSADERASGVYNAYRTAAQHLGVGLITTYGERRKYSTVRGKEAYEPSVMYFTFTQKKAPSNGHSRQPVKIGDASTTFQHGVEVTR